MSEANENSETNPEEIKIYKNLSAEEKDKIIRGFAEITSKGALELFIMLDLKTHFECMVVNDVDKSEYILSFKKV